MNTKDKRKLLISFSIFLILVAGMLLFIFKGYDIGTFSEALRLAKTRYLLIGLGCILVFITCEAININRTLVAMGFKPGIGRCIKYGAAGYFFCGITPSATGGQPAQLYLMNKDIIPVSYGSLALLTEVTAYQIVSYIFVAISFVVERKYLITLNRGFLVAICVGVVGNTLFITMLMALLFSKRFALVIEKLLVKIVKRFGKSEKIQKRIENITIRMSEYRSGSEYIRKNPKILIKNMPIALIKLMAICSIPYLVLLSLGGTNASWMQMMFLQSLLTSSITIVPLPGGTGAGELGFMLLFTSIFGADSITAGMLISRGLGFYLGLVISVIALVGITTYEKAKYKNAKR